MPHAMAGTAFITDNLLQDSIVKAVQNVCRTMLRQEAVLVETTPACTLTSLGPPPHIIGSVGFAGEANGMVYLGFSEQFARSAAGRILGMSAGEVEMHGYEVVKDVVGEITNMTTGGFKNALCDIGFPCKLSLPTIVRGDNLVVAAIKSASRQVFHFTVGEHRLIADVQLRSQ